MNTTKSAADRRIPYLVNDLPVPYRVRVETASPELRAFVVPRLSVRLYTPGDRASETRIRVRAA
jgi:hypothetical protein